MGQDFLYRQYYFLQVTEIYNCVLYPIWSRKHSFMFHILLGRLIFRRGICIGFDIDIGNALYPPSPRYQNNACSKRVKMFFCKASKTVSVFTFSVCVFQVIFKYILLYYWQIWPRQHSLLYKVFDIRKTFSRGKTYFHLGSFWNWMLEFETQRIQSIDHT